MEDVPPVVEIEQEAPIIPIEEVKALEEIIDTTPKIEPIVQQEVAQESPLIQASVDLKSFITTTLAAKIEELRIQMTTKLAQQEENVLSQLKKLEDVKAGKKDVAPKKK